MTERQIVRVTAETNSKQLAVMLRERYREYDVLREYKTVPEPALALQAMGPAAVNAAVKSIVELNKMLASTGTYASTVPAFEEIMLRDQGSSSGELVPRSCITLVLRRQAMGSVG